MPFRVREPTGLGEPERIGVIGPPDPSVLFLFRDDAGVPVHVEERPAEAAVIGKGSPPLCGEQRQVTIRGNPVVVEWGNQTRVARWVERDLHLTVMIDVMRSTDKAVVGLVHGFWSADAP